MTKENVTNPSVNSQNSLQKVFSRTWEAAMRLKGSVVVNDSKLFL